jgi:uncharacterized protein YcbK (DUF882 family)
MGNITEHFSKHEFTCKCGYGLMNVKGRLLVTLEAIRTAIDGPVNIECGCRCASHNKAVGGVDGSAYLTGEAADIWVDRLSNRELGLVIKSLHKKGKLPYLRYCYLIKGSTDTRVHVGVDEKLRSGVFGF